MPCPILPALVQRAADGPIPFDELAFDWLPRLTAAGVVCHFAWVDELGIVCEVGQGKLALVWGNYETSD